MALPEYLFLSSREGGTRGTTLRPLSVPVSLMLRSSDANLEDHPLEADPLGVGAAGLNGTLTVREGRYSITYLGRTVSWARRGQ